MFTEGTVGAGLFLLHNRNSLPLGSEFLAVRRFLPPGCTSWVPGACSCIHKQNQRNLYRWDLNSWLLPDAPCYWAAHRGCRSLAPAFTYRISAIFTVGTRIPGGQTFPAAGLHIVGAVRLLLHSHTESAFSHTESVQSLPLASEFLPRSARRFLPTGCTSWVPCDSSCIDTQNQRFHTQNQRNLYCWHPNSCRPDASCRRAVHRGCQALAPAFTHRISVLTHRISAISTVGIRIPGGQTLPAAGLHIVGAVRLLLHSHTESAFSHTELAQSLPLASEFLTARRFLQTGCTS